jgi:ATP-dependent 26S proteasome regulatory subunit
MCIVGIDEIDTLGSSRSNGSRSGELDHTATVATLLTELDGLANSRKYKDVNVIIIGTTNRAQALDPALTASGRLEKLVCIGLPKKSKRQELLTYYLGQHNLSSNFANESFRSAVTKLKGSSATRIKQYVEDGIKGCIHKKIQPLLVSESAQKVSQHDGLVIRLRNRIRGWFVKEKALCPALSISREEVLQEILQVPQQG